MFLFSQAQAAAKNRANSSNTSDNSNNDHHNDHDSSDNNQNSNSVAKKRPRVAVDSGSMDDPTVENDGAFAPGIEVGATGAGGKIMEAGRGYRGRIPGRCGEGVFDHEDEMQASMYLLL